jgi:hypothetical protein
MSLFTSNLKQKTKIISVDLFEATASLFVVVVGQCILFTAELEVAAEIIDR